VNDDSTDVQNLIALKRFEGPSDEYFDEFLQEFHRRQREDVLKRSARSLLLERLQVWFRELGMAKWAYGAGVAYAALMIAFVAWPRNDQPSSVTAPALPGNRNLEHVDLEKPAPKDEDEQDEQSY
jgi:hypothetical protein